jgi:hypothetical protein
MELVNLTPFAAERLILMNGEGFEVLLVVVKATYGLRAGVPEVADVQEAVVMADEYLGEPGASSVRRAAETSLGKPAADVVVTGAAWSRRDRRTEALVVLDIGPVRKALMVRGDRVWEGRLWTSAPSPRPFESIPLVYERAFGGVDRTTDPVEAWPENPVGRGFRGKGSKAQVAGTALPNLEDVYQPITKPTDRPPSRCLGPIGPGWQPRPQFAGTYDALWRRERMPFPPADFDSRFEHPVPPDQVLPGYIAGGEQLTLSGVRPDGGGYRFALPALQPKVVVRIAGERVTPKVCCDTVIVDSEAENLCLVCRAVLKVQGRVSDIDWIKVEEQAHA